MLHLQDKARFDVIEGAGHKWFPIVVQVYVVGTAHISAQVRWVVDLYTLHPGLPLLCQRTRIPLSHRPSQTLFPGLAVGQGCGGYHSASQARDCGP